MGVTKLLLATVLLFCTSASAAGHGLSAAALNLKLSFQPYEETWRAFKTAYGRQYTAKLLEGSRYKIFLENLKTMELHNAKFKTGNTTFWMGINQFADMTLDEYKAYNRLQATEGNASRPMDGDLQCSLFLPPLNYETDSTVGDSVDWRKKGYVTAIKNQGQCGSCWAFSTTGSLEGQHYRKAGCLLSLSEQQLVDCSSKNHGCDGGIVPLAYAYIYSAGGIETELDYPYEAQNGRCRFKKSRVATKLSGCKLIRKGSEVDLRTAVSGQGPVSVAINASPDSFRFYSGGVYNDKRCGSNPLNHAVLVVGYGTLNGKAYWIVKNSWGKSWGDKGYMLMARNSNNMCGIASSASFPVV